MQITGFYMRKGKLLTASHLLAVAPMLVASGLVLHTSTEVINYIQLLNLALQSGIPVEIMQMAVPELLKPLLESPAFQEMISNPEMIEHLPLILRGISI